ncbi:MAG: cbb3-type cytochrome oxidase subunit 3 [Rubrivivax sp.]
MDINDLRSAVTVISLLLFVGLVAITMKPSRRSEFEEAAHLPFAEDTSGEDRP